MCDLINENMKKNLILFNCLVLLSLFTSCKHNEGPFPINNAITFNIDLENKESENEPLRTSEIVDSVSFVPINASKGIIGQVVGLKMINGLYYISDRETNSIFIVSSKGKVIGKISKQGKSREEYLNIAFFDVNCNNNEISIYDGGKRVINVYDKKGTFLRLVKLEDVIRDFAVLKNGDYLFYTPDYMKNRRGVWQTDSNGIFKKQLVTIEDEFKYGGLYPNYFRRINNDTIALMGGEDHNFIYHFAVDTMFVSYKINVKQKIPEELLHRSVLDPNNYKGLIYTKYDFQETSRIMCFAVSDLLIRQICFYDKKRKKTWLIKKNKDIIQDKMICLLPTYCYEDKMIGILYPNDILRTPELKKKLPQITLDSNPVLMIMNMKK